MGYCATALQRRSWAMAAKPDAPMGKGRPLARSLARVAGAGAVVLAVLLAFLAPQPVAAAGTVSTVSTPSVAIAPSTAASTFAAYNVTFSTPAAIPAGGSITLLGPAGTLWPGATTPCDYSVVDLTSSSGDVSCPAEGPTVKLADGGLPVFSFNDVSGAAVSIGVPNPIAAGSRLEITADGTINPGPGRYTLSVATSASPQLVASAPYTIGAETAVTRPSVKVLSNAGGATTTYDIGFTVRNAIPAGGTITVLGPPGTVWPGTQMLCDYDLVDLTTPSGDDGCPAENPAIAPVDNGSFIYDFLDRAGAEVTLTTKNAVNAGDHLSFDISAAISPGPGTYRIGVATSSDPVVVASAPYSLGVPTAVARPSVSVGRATKPTPGLTFVVRTTLRHALPVGGTISLWGPPGTRWPSDNSYYTVTDETSAERSPSSSNPTESRDGPGNGALVTITLPPQNAAGATYNGLNAGDVAQVSITGVTAPAGAGAELAVSTSSDPAWVFSAPFTVGGRGPARSGPAVSAQGMTLSSAVAGANGVTGTFRFSTARALAGGRSTITVVGAPGTIFGSCAYGCGMSDLGNNASYDLTDLTRPAASGGATVDVLQSDWSAVTMTVPKDVRAGDRLELTITQTTAPVAGTDRFWLWTSAQPAPARFSARLVPPGAVGSPSVAVSSAAAGAEGVTYAVSFTDRQPLLAGLGAITLAASPGTVFGGCPYGCGSGNTSITVTDAQHPSPQSSVGGDWVGAGGSTLSFLVPANIDSGDRVTVTVTQVTNPPAGRAGVAVSTSSAPVPVAAPVDFVPAGAVASPTEQVGPAAAGTAAPTTSVGGPALAGRDITVSFTAGRDGELLAGLGDVTLIAPTGLDLASAQAATVTDRSHPSASGALGTPAVAGGGSIVSYRVPRTVKAGDVVSLTLTDVGVPPGAASRPPILVATSAQLAASHRATAGPPPPVRSPAKARHVAAPTAPPRTAPHVKAPSTPPHAKAPTQPHHATAPVRRHLATAPTRPTRAAGRPRGQTSSIARSLLTPREAFSPIGDAIVNAAITVGVVLFITFPANLFNQTFSENYDEIVGWWRKLSLAAFPEKARRRARSLARSALRKVTSLVPGGVKEAPPGAPAPHHRENAAFAAVVAVGALLGTLLDPQFGANLRTLTSWVAIVLAMLAGVSVSGLVTHGYHRARRHGKVPYRLQALPLGLLVAAACVVVSRLTGFEPGYLYGVICGVKFGRDLADHEQGHVVALSTAATLVLAIAAWSAWDVLNPVASKPGAFFGGVVADDFLSSLFVSGLVGTVISLLPLRSLPGHKLQSWHKGVWAAAFGVSLFLLVDAIVRPDSHVAQRSHAPLVTALALSIAFGLGSLAFHQYFARRHKEDEAGQEGGGEAGAGSGVALVEVEQAGQAVPSGAEE